jgi:subtilisin family serine protease
MFGANPYSLTRQVLSPFVAGVSAAQAPRRRGGLDDYVVVNIEFKNTAARIAFRQLGAAVFNATDRFADVFISAAQFERTMDAIAKRPDVVWLEPAGLITAPPKPRPAQVPTTRQVPEQIIRGGLKGLTGRGVVIAIIDSGIDFRNPDFITYDSQGHPTSRLLYLWDTTSNAFDASGRGSKPPISYPNSASLGTLYTREQLTAELRSGSNTIPATDLNGHGTACAGIAAGNGNNDRRQNGARRPETLGVAPEADLIAVRIGKEGEGPENAYLLNAAVVWLDKIVGTQPLVISQSFGGHRGGHDGELIEERELNARLNLSRRGRAIVAAAGNEGTESFHARVTFGAQSAASLVTWQTADATNLDIYLNSGDDDILVAPAGKTKLKVGDGWTNPFTNQFVAKVGIEAGEGGLWIFDNSGRTNTANLYIRNQDAVFDSVVVSHETLINTPATAQNVLAIGSYDWNDTFELSTGLVSFRDLCVENKTLTIGGLSCYSSPGYSRNGSVKPEITAPGEWFVASYAKNLDGTGVGTDWTVDQTGKYIAMNGTSAATPYSAGVIALMFQKRSTLTFGDVRQLLMTKASSSDLATGPVPNPNWGYGKLDYAAVERILNQIER